MESRNSLHEGKVTEDVRLVLVLVLVLVVLVVLVLLLVWCLCFVAPAAHPGVTLPLLQVCEWLSVHDQEPEWLIDLGFEEPEAPPDSPCAHFFAAMRLSSVDDRACAEIRRAQQARTMLLPPLLQLLLHLLLHLLLLLLVHLLCCSGCRSSRGLLALTVGLS